MRHARFSSPAPLLRPPPVNEDVQIRALCDDDDISSITSLLHAAYAPLAEMVFAIWRPTG